MHRRSIRKYEDREIPREDLLEILRLAGRAPSSQNVQPWRWVVVTDHEAKQRLMAAAMNQPQVGSAAAVFVLYSDMDDALARIEEWIHPGIQGEARQKRKESTLASIDKMSPEARHAWGRGQAYIALGYLLLVLESLGYGSSPMLGFDPEQVKALLDLPPHAEIPAIVAVGIPAENGFEPFRHEPETITRFV